jgi:hypothetical protein
MPLPATAFCFRITCRCAERFLVSGSALSRNARGSAIRSAAFCIKCAFGQMVNHFTHNRLVLSENACLHHFDPEHSCESLGSREKQQTACEQRKAD